MIYRLILLLLPFSFLSAQIKTKEISNFDFTQARGLEFFEDHLYMDVGHNVMMRGIRDSLFIYKLDLNLNVVDSVLLRSFIISANPYYINVGQIKVIDSSLVISVGYTTGDTSLGCWEGESALLFLDADLNLRKRIVIPSEGDQLLIYNQSACERGVLFSGSHYSCSTFIKSPVIGIWAGDFYLALNCATGDPNIPGTLTNEDGERPHDGKEYRPYGGSTPDQYRLGSFTIGYKGFFGGANAEVLRHNGQNKFAHNILLKGHAKHFRQIPAADGSPASAPYFGYRTKNPFTIW